MSIAPRASRVAPVSGVAAGPAANSGASQYSEGCPGSGGCFVVVMPAGISAGVLVPLAGFCARATMHSASTAATTGRIEERLNECIPAPGHGAASERYALLRAYG